MKRFIFAPCTSLDGMAFKQVAKATWTKDNARKAVVFPATKAA